MDKCAHAFTLIESWYKCVKKNLSFSASPSQPPQAAITCQFGVDGRLELTIGCSLPGFPGCILEARWVAKKAWSHGGKHLHIILLQGLQRRLPHQRRRHHQRRTGQLHRERAAGKKCNRAVFFIPPSFPCCRTLGPSTPLCAISSTATVREREVAREAWCWEDKEGSGTGPPAKGSSPSPPSALGSTRRRRRRQAWKRPFAVAAAVAFVQLINCSCCCCCCYYCYCCCCSYCYYFC